MEYHRKQMNQYLCHGYIAEEIFKEIGTVRVKRRNEFSSGNSIPDFLGEQNITVHDKLLSDEGSLKYKDWLHRTTTLDDIYRHYSPSNTFNKKHEVYEDSESEGDIEEFEGEISGYSVPSPISTGKIGKPGGYSYPSYGIPLNGAPPLSHNHRFVPAIHEQHIYLPSQHNNEDEHPIYHEKDKGHDLSIKDFFEIALTALAFLSFGLFVIQLLMNITAPMMTTTTTASTVVASIDQRFRRHVLDAPSLAYAEGNAEIDELAHRVLRSIEAALVAPADSGNCLRRILCEDNRYSRNTQGGQRIWIPAWSMSMSWTAGRMLNQNPWSAMLDSVKASVLGLGRAKCETLYPDCDLRRERVKRRRRRRK
ncbi:PREDICTED: uncharacterized protein LOC105365210 [Ceratosolen solmsi marchali]|uniref:Uncharacterized protein LOC105365210 n=1 Tax=Ceratosolen solmsi marchali TaxID=326594 RepID=A0AAJ6YP23_9HYME|nr:PREDICTED: uncharacterized protein LOC105365210 [Ceratosolen solmsi marchali]